MLSLLVVALVLVLGFSELADCDQEGDYEDESSPTLSETSADL